MSTLIDTAIGELAKQNKLYEVERKKYSKKANIIFAIWILLLFISMFFTGDVPDQYTVPYVSIIMIAMFIIVWISLKPKDKAYLIEEDIRTNNKISETLNLVKELEWKTEAEKILIIEKNIIENN